jgi:hypothetical protein
MVKPHYNCNMTKRYIYEETTDWGSHSATNNVYVFDSAPKGQRTIKCLAYVKQGSKIVERFKTPYTFDLRGRTFKELK